MSTYQRPGNKFRKGQEQGIQRAGGMQKEARHLTLVRMVCRRAIVAALMKYSTIFHVFALLAQVAKSYERVSAWSSLDYRSSSGKAQATADSLMRSKSLDLPLSKPILLEKRHYYGNLRKGNGYWVPRKC